MTSGKKKFYFCSRILSGFLPFTVSNKKAFIYSEQSIRILPGILAPNLFKDELTSWIRGKGFVSIDILPVVADVGRQQLDYTKWFCYRAGPPIVVLLTDSIDHGKRKDGELPPALQDLHGKSLIEHWWTSLEALGLNLQTHVFVATNAVNYKFFEFWAHSKGIATSHIINSGRSLGDTRCVRFNGV